MVDIFKDSKLREDIKKEFDEKIGEYDCDDCCSLWCFLLNGINIC